MSDKKGEENEEAEKKATSRRAEPYFEDMREQRRWEEDREKRRFLLLEEKRLEEQLLRELGLLSEEEELSEDERRFLLYRSSLSPFSSYRQVFRASRTEVDYLNALGHGETKVAYARVMIVGPGGVGKSSLLNGLMNLPLPCEAYSTQVADTFSLRPTESYWACSQEGKFWTKIIDADEIKAMAQLIQTILEHKDSNSATESDASSGSDVSSGKSQSSKIVPKFDDPLIEGIWKEILSVITTDDPFIEEEVYLNVWDCGGQPVFLKILRAFLTARTLFLLMFDARLDLHDQCRSLTYLKGRATEHLEDISTLDLMVQWISTIHATLLNKRLFFDKENDKDEAFPKYPRILPVGSHGDDFSVKERKDEILEKLSTEFTDKAFSDIVLDGAIVDNTTAGKGELEEDNTFKVIRTIVNKFATKNLAIRTPITWLLFRKVFQRYARSQKKPVVPLEEVKKLCRACLIPEDTLTSILAFYHDLAVFFHYSDIPSLKSCVIADPQWLIKQIARLLALEGREEYRNSRLWKLLREDGVLVESLYQEVLSAQKELQPQQIVDLLEHFLIIATISIEKHKGPGMKYFVPSMLPHLLKVDDPQSISTAIKFAIPFHLVFNTNYLPPGFFTQLAAVMSKHPKCYLPVNEKIYRNQIQFLFGSPGQQQDRLFITEEKFSVRVDVQRINSREYNCPFFISSCRDILEILQDSSSDIKKWLPGTNIDFALKCEGCPQNDHFVILPSYPTTSNPSLICQKGNQTKLNDFQKFWFNIRQDHSPNANISSSELEVIAMEVLKCETVKELAEALEMSEHLPYIENDAMILLEKWQKEMEMMNIPARPYLLNHLSCIGIKDMQMKLMYHKDGSYKEKETHTPQALNQLQSAPQLQPGCSPTPTQSTPSLTSKIQPLGTSSAPDSEPTRKSVEASQVKDDTLSSCSPPTMTDIICCPLQDSKVNLTKEVGTKYLEFGTLLLEDQTGARISALERELMKKAQDINYRVFHEWLLGEGRQPVSWETLVSVLEDIGLNQLAESIRDTVIWKGKRSLIDEQPLTESKRHHQSSRFAHTVGTSPLWDEDATIESLQLIKYFDCETAKHREIRILDDLAPYWKKIAELVGIPPYRIKSVAKQESDVDCLRDVIGEWLANAPQMPHCKRYSEKWRGLYNLLKDGRQEELAADLKAALNAEKCSIHGKYEDSEVLQQFTSASTLPISKEAHTPQGKRSLIDEQPLTKSKRHHQSSQFAHTALNQLPQLQPGCSPTPTQSTPSLTSKPQPLGTSSAPDSQPMRKSIEASQVKDDTLSGCMTPAEEEQKDKRKRPLKEGECQEPTAETHEMKRARLEDPTT